MRLVKAVFHLKTGCIVPQENYTVDNFVKDMFKVAKFCDKKFIYDMLHSQIRTP